MVHRLLTRKPKQRRNIGITMTRLNIYIRTATLSDLDKISDIYQQINQHKHSRKIIKKTIEYNITNIQFANPIHFYVACCGSELLAFSVARYRKREAAYEVECACKDTFRGRGLGHTLIKHIITECNKDGFLHFIANVQPDNFICLNMLKKLGFKEDKTDNPFKNTHSKLVLNL